MTSRAFLWIFAVVVVGATSHIANGGDAMDRLVRSKWRIMAAESRGESDPKEEGQIVTFTEDKMLVDRPSGKVEVGYSINDTVTPIEIDWWDLRPNGKQYGRGIIRFDDNSFQLCGRLGFNRKVERPKEFKTKEGDAFNCMLLGTRVEGDK